MKTRTQGLLSGAGLILITLVWGGGFVVVKDSVNTVPPIYMIAVRFTIASVLLAAVFWKNLTRMNSVTLRRGALLGVFLFLSYAFQTIGVIYTTAGKNAFLTTIYVILVPLIVWVFTRKPPGLHVFVAAVVAIFGIGLLSLDDDLYINIGDVLTLICGLFFALHIFFIARFTQDSDEDPIVLTVLQMFFTAALSWIFAPLYDGPFPHAAFLTQRSLLSILYLAIFPSSIAFLLQNVCQKYLKPTTASLLLSLESVFGAVASVIFLHEVMSGRMIFGCALLFSAILMSEIKLTRRRKEEE
jgi:drug/metabolite transporter (DMT)-like permease